MAYWLFKSEPSCWSWQEHVRAGVAEWDGVRNFQARGYLRAMVVGDRGFFYHSVTEKRIVGIVEVVKPYYPDPSDERGLFGMVDVRAVEAMKRAVTLADIKADERLAHIPLLRQSRLSVMPIDDAAWRVIMELGGHT
ncbi:MAG: EVE domain-containing protein [Alphaproteobacteria bacterium GM202ARS2]|nr:EVE domain-containing protein [Alphaproteobacteria bacterium GM202ARS2]